MTANTTRGYTYPQSTDHTRIWEHFQELAGDVNSDVANIAAKTLQAPLCILSRAGGIAAAVASGGALLGWDTDVTDLSGWHTGSSTDIVPTLAGWVRFSATIHWSNGSASGRRGVGIRKNGATTYYGEIKPGTTVGNTSCVADVVLDTNGVSDTFSVFAFQDSGVSLNIVDTTSTRFTAQYLRELT